MHRRTGFRGWAVLWAVLQFALPAAASLADARLERLSAGADRTHVESTSGASCRPAHPAECALCQIVSRAVASTHRAPCPAIAERVVAPVAERPAARAAGGVGELPTARAPPAV